MKLSDAIAGYKLDRLSSNASPITIKGYCGFGLKKFLDYFGDVELESITTDQVKQFFVQVRSTKLSSASVKAVWTAVRSFYNWASKEFGIQRPDNIPAPAFSYRVIVPFTQEEIKKLIRACEVTAPAKTKKGRKSFTMARPTANRDKAMVLLLLDTGLRASECARLKIQDVDLETGDVEVKPYLSGRKSKARVVQLGKSARRTLWRYLADRGALDPDDPLFLSSAGGHMDRHAICNVVEGLGKRAGVNRCHPHKFRHTFAIQFLRNGGDVFTLQRLLGHASLEMVRHYLDLARADDASAHRRASPADNWKL